MKCLLKPLSLSFGLPKGSLPALRLAASFAGSFSSSFGARALQRVGKGNKAAVVEIKAKADRHAADLLPIIEDIRANGAVTLIVIAAEAE